MELENPAAAGPGSLGGVVRFAAPLRQQVVDHVRGSILDGRYAPGSRLIERVLCEEMQVSRTVVREALRQLESEHLIELVPNVGPIVRSLSRTEVQSLYEVRAVLESLAGGTCAERVTPLVVQALDDSLAVMEGLADDDIAGLLRAKDAFIGVLIAGSGNVVIGDMLGSIHARVNQLRALTLRAPGRMKTTVDELRVIREAVARGASDDAARACRLHVENAAAIALASFGG